MIEFPQGSQPSSKPTLVCEVLPVFNGLHRYLNYSSIPYDSGKSSLLSGFLLATTLQVVGCNGCKVLFAHVNQYPRVQNQASDAKQDGPVRQMCCVVTQRRTSTRRVSSQSGPGLYKIEREHSLFNIGNKTARFILDAL
jgi:hypothetical protein